MRAIAKKSRATLSVRRVTGPSLPPPDGTGVPAYRPAVPSARALRADRARFGDSSAALVTVEVEVEVANDMPIWFSIAGLPDAAVSAKVRRLYQAQHASCATLGALEPANRRGGR